MFPTPFNSSMKLWYNLSNKHSWYTSWTFNPLSVSVFVAYISCKQNIIGSITFHNNKHNVLDTHIITFAGDVSRSEPPHHCRHLRPCPQSPVSSGPAQNRNIAASWCWTHYTLQSTVTILRTHDICFHWMAVGCKGTGSCKGTEFLNFDMILSDCCNCCFHTLPTEYIQNLCTFKRVVSTWNQATQLKMEMQDQYR